MSNPTRTQQLVYDQAGAEAGVATGAVHRCRMEGCQGERVSVRWPDDHFTYHAVAAWCFAPMARARSAEGFVC